MVPVVRPDILGSVGETRIGGDNRAANPVRGRPVNRPPPRPSPDSPQGRNPENVTPNPGSALSFFIGASAGSGLLRLSSLVDLIEIEVGEDVGAMPQSILLLVFLQVGRGCVGIAPASLHHVFIPHVDLDR